MEKILGIDLGTTNSVMAILDHDEPIVIPNKRGDRLTPSVVAFTKNNETLVGKAAKNQAIINSDRTISSIKRDMGSARQIEIGNKKYSPQEISALILSELKKDAEEYLGDTINKAVITVPAYFNDNQRQATKDAGKIAGLEVMRIINEPTAASLFNGLNDSEEQNVLVYDLGGGTFDVSILEIAEGVFQVKATCGNNKLGGDDFDEALLKLILHRYKEEEGIDLSNDKMAIQKLREEVEKAKIELSEVNMVEINIPFISADQSGPKHLNLSIKRSDFEELIDEYIEETINLTKKAVEDADLAINDISKVLLVGGSTRIPKVQFEVAKLLGDEKVLKNFNPDEIVALGAAIQAGIIAGEKKGVVLVDVTPLSLGIEIEGGIFTPIIERNTSIPTTQTKLFTTVANNQKSVEIHVLQGERTRACENISLGKFQLNGIRNAEKGEPRIEVTFGVDVDGIVNVSAKDLDTDAEHHITITNQVSLSEEKIEEIIEEARKNREQDMLYITKQKKMELLRNNYNMLKESFKKGQEIIEVEEDLKSEIEKAIMDGAKILNSNGKKYDNLEEITDCNDNIKFLLGEINSELEKMDYKDKTK